jgi:hypothetical protein
LIDRYGAFDEMRIIREREVPEENLPQPFFFPAQPYMT